MDIRFVTEGRGDAVAVMAGEGGQLLASAQALDANRRACGEGDRRAALHGRGRAKLWISWRRTASISRACW